MLRWTMPNNKPVLVFDIGGTKVACAVWTPEGDLVARTEIDTQAAAGPEAVAGRIVELGHRVLARVASERPDLLPPSAAGVASAGQIDVATGTVSYATFHLPGWIGFRAGAEAERRSEYASNGRQRRQLPRTGRG